ncbi:MAG: hypothetical protein ACYC7L_01675 [Nitrospirota bacterium]
MTVWEKTLINLQQGHARLLSFAAIFSERLRAEINIIRIRMQIDAVRGKLNEQHRFIGQRLLSMKENDALPRTTELLFQNDEIAASLEKIERYHKDLEILLDDLQHEADVLKPSPKHEETAA